MYPSVHGEGVLSCFDKDIESAFDGFFKVFIFLVAPDDHISEEDLAEDGHRGCACQRLDALEFACAFQERGAEINIVRTGKDDKEEKQREDGSDHDKVRDAGEERVDSKLDGKGEHLVDVILVFIGSIH